MSSTVIFFFFFNDTATTEIYTLSLHDALPISPTNNEISSVPLRIWSSPGRSVVSRGACRGRMPSSPSAPRSEEHTSELQSRQYLVCRLLLEKKKKKITNYNNNRLNALQPTTIA